MSTFAKRTEAILSAMMPLTVPFCWAATGIVQMNTIKDKSRTAIGKIIALKKERIVLENVMVTLSLAGRAVNKGFKPTKIRPSHQAAYFLVMSSKCLCGAEIFMRLP